ncbi:MAG: methionine--tRNA ligase [Candidatus Dormibacteraeota bacterium]|uniref:Methionine--tRNA ligase n=1 Tax=Candidatus Aeolococcus gillhamiae TaxID=3127015 RepID=A0A934JZJ3_9BACT|nr:methionine--tRNA ligase [Candidatus Dormibacteraeota bacterium]
MTRPEPSFYVTAAIDYVNGDPHLGHAYEKIGCDVLARHRRLRGDDVRFTVGSDEHSQSVERAARAAGMEPADYCTRQVDAFKTMMRAFDVEPTSFVRTSSDANRRTSETLWRALADAGHIYKDWYRAWFCPFCEQFYTEKEIVAGMCPIHQTPVEWVEEQNWFFRLSEFAEPLLDLYEREPDFVVPPPRRNEMLSVIRGGLTDISISRGFSTWGIPVPGDESQVIWVWLDALPAYLTGVGYPDGDDFARFWPADVHVVGKDITRFHSVIWPAILMAAGVPLPRKVHAHGFITLAGEKMSKSRGIFIEPMQLVDQFGSDAVRWVLLSEVPFDRDGDFSIAKFIDRYNADLANDYGNLVSRTTKMVQRYFGGRVPALAERAAIDDELRSTAARVVPVYDAAIDDLQFSEAMAAARQLVGRANKYIEQTAPWTLQRDGDARLGTVCAELLEAVRVSTMLLHPIIPRATARVAAEMGLALGGDLTDEVRSWPRLAEGAPVAVGEILFPRLDREAVLAAE